MIKKKWQGTVYWVLIIMVAGQALLPPALYAADLAVDAPATAVPDTGDSQTITLPEPVPSPDSIAPPIIDVPEVSVPTAPEVALPGQKANSKSAPVGEESGAQPMALTSGSDTTAPYDPALMSPYNFAAGNLRQALNSSGVNSFSGSFGHQISLAIPSGRAGLQPSISLNYSSQNREDSGLGLGWDLPLAWIKQSNKYTPGELLNSHNFDFSLFGSGGELVPLTVANNYGSYGARVDSGEALQVQYLSSETWQIIDKAGRVYKFGSTDASRENNPTAPTQIYKWLLEEVRDTSGNWIKYSYIKDQSKIYLDSIEYTGNGANGGLYQIKFNYENRLAPLTSYRAGFKTVLAKQLKSIEVKTAGTKRREYLLNYTKSSTSSGNLLTSVQEVGWSEGGMRVELPATTFEYQAGEAGWKPAVESNITLPQKQFRTTDANETGGSFFMDLNNDGLTDIYADPSNLQAFRNNGNGTFSQTAWAKPFTQNLHNTIWANSEVLVIDLNGDALTDALVERKLAYLSDGVGGWLRAPQWDMPLEYGNGLIGDVNGDGLVDFVYSRLIPGFNTTPDQYDKKVTLNTGSGWELRQDWQIPAYFIYDHDTVWKYELADVNGDGLADIVDYRNGMGVFLNNGKDGWEATISSNWRLPKETDGSPWKEIYTNDSRSTYPAVRLADVNGDGLADLIRSYNEIYIYNNFPDNLQHSEVYLNNGATGWALAPGWSVPKWFVTKVIDYFPYGPFWNLEALLTDINGDGLTDIVKSYYGEDPNGYTKPFNGNRQFIWHQEVFLKKGAVPDILTKVNYSTGGKTSVTYGLSTSYPNSQLPFAVSVVSQIKEENGLGQTNITNYDYSGGFYNKSRTSGNDNQFAGFQIVTVRDASGRTTKTYYHQGEGSVNSSTLGEYQDHWTKIGRAYRSEVYDTAGNLYQTQITKWRNLDLGGGRWQVLQDRTITLTYDATASHRDQATSWSYDAYGNVIHEINWGEVNTDWISAENFSPSGYWMMDEGNGTTVGDSSGNGSTGTLRGTENWTASGISGRAINFDGSSSFVDLGTPTALDLTNTGIFTIVGWIKGDTFTNNYYPQIYIDGGWRVSFGFHKSFPGRLAAYTNNSFLMIGNTSLLPGAWYHVALVSDGTERIFYVNGVNDGESGWVKPGGRGLCGIGGNEISYTPFDGIIDDLRIYHQALSAEKIDALYRDPGGPGASVGELSFTDTGTDKITTNYTYALNAGANIVGLPSSKIIQDQNGVTINQERYYYDALALGQVSLGNLTRQERWLNTNSSWVATSREYNSFGLPTRETDPRGNSSTYIYDGYNLYPASVTNALNQTIQFTYDYGSGQVKRVTDPNGIVQEKIYDGFGRVITLSTSDQNKSAVLILKQELSFNDAVMPRSVIKRDYLSSETGPAETYQYFDGFGRVIQSRTTTETAGSYSVSTLIYDARGRVAQEYLPYAGQGTAYQATSQPTTQAKVYTYDALDRVIQTATAVGNTVNQYNLWTARIIDANNHAKKYYYDAYGRIIKIDEENGATVYQTNYTYDPLGSLIKIIDAENNEREFTYDSLSRQVTAELAHRPSATAAQYQYQYDSNGNKTSQTYPDGHIVNWTYDVLNRALTQDDPTTPASETVYVYDTASNGIGQVAQMQTADITILYQYDGQGHLVQEARGIVIPEPPAPELPEIALVYNGSEVAAGGTVETWNVDVGSFVEKTFAINNTGSANLNLTGSPLVAISGTNADQFSVTQQPVSPITPAGSTAFKIKFTPTSAGAKIATLTIQNNDADEGNYVINLQGQSQLVYKAYLLNPLSVSKPLTLTSLAAGNQIKLYNPSGTLLNTYNLNLYQTATISTAQAVSGLKVVGTAPFNVYDVQNATESLISDRYRGMLFAFPNMRYTHEFYLLSPDSAAQVTIEKVGSTTETVNLTAGVVYKYTAGTWATKSTIITANVPILVLHKTSETYDAVNLYPATTQAVYGVQTYYYYISATADSTTVNIWASNGQTKTVTLARGARSLNPLSYGGSQGSGQGFKIKADKPIAVYQYNDGDGAESSTFLPETEFVSTITLPTATQYVAVVTNQAGTVTLKNASGVVLETQTAVATAPGKLYFGSTTNISKYPAGTRLEASVPIFAMYEFYTYSDERNLVATGPVLPVGQLAQSGAGSQMGATALALDEGAGGFSPLRRGRDRGGLSTDLPDISIAGKKNPQPVNPDIPLIPPVVSPEQLGSVPAQSSSLLSKAPTVETLSASQTSAASGLIGLWHFDENQGNAIADSSGNNSTGNLQGTANWVTGVSGSAVNFDGSSNLVNLGTPAALDLTTTGLFTIAGWIKGDSFTNRYYPQIYIDGGWRVSFGFHASFPGRLAAYTNNSFLMFGNTSLSPGVWYHVALVSDGVHRIFYVNGVNDGEDQWVQPGGRGLCGIGGNDSTYTPFDGVIDELRVYNRALTPAEIMGLYNDPTGTLPPDSFVTRSSYDNFGVLQEIIYPDKTTVEYDYNVLGKIEVARQNGGTVVSAVDYTVTGAIGKQNYANNVQSIYTYDANKLYRLTNKKTTFGAVAYQDISYTYDSVGNITRVVDVGTGLPHDAQYNYDALDRLVRAAITSGTTTTEDYTYSATGNILSKTGVGAYQYNDARHPAAVTLAGWETFSYNGNGRLTSAVGGGGGGEYTYDYLNRLTTLTNTAGTSHYLYGDGYDRVQKILPDGTSRTYLGELSEVDQTGAFTDYVFADNMRIATSDPTGLYYNSNDHLTSASVLTDAAGLMVQKLDYFPFGSERVNEKVGGFQTHFTFTDQEKDAESGLMYYGARYYDPVIGRFTSVDPAIFTINKQLLYNPQYWNAYSYTVNNPLKYVDPNGKGPKETIGGAVVGFVESVGNTAIWFGQQLAHPMQTVASMANAVSLAAAEISDTISNPGQAFSEAGQGYAQQAQESGTWYWNASDYERGQVLGQITEKAVEAYALGKFGGKALGKIGTSQIDANKLNHIFGTKSHNLDALVKEFGTQQKAYEAINQATQSAITKEGTTGVFEINVTVGKQQITVRGNVTDGVAKIGTAYKK